MPATLTELRRLLVRLTWNAEADLAALWSQLDAATVREGLFDVMPSLVSDYGDTAATLSAEWYDEYRSDLDVQGSYDADLPDLSLGAEALAGWGSSLAQDDWDSALAQISGGLVKRVMVASRETITENTFRDPQAEGWQRYARPDACGFCVLLASRGSVFRTRGTADFGAHDSCHCVAVPKFGGRPVAVRPYIPSSRNITDADRARVHEWIKLKP